MKRRINAIPHHAVTKDIACCTLMVMPVDATLQAREKFDNIIERTFDIIIELVTTRAGMHDKDRAVEKSGVFTYFPLHKVEIRHCRHIIIFRSVGVEADKLDAACNEREIQTVTKRRFPHLITCTKKIVIADQHDIRLLEFLEDIITPFILTRRTGIRKVAAMNDEIDTVVAID